MDLTVRRARTGDGDRVAAFTAETWADREVDDYVADAFPAWVEGDGPDQRTLVAEVDGVVTGVIQGALLTAHEGWLAGLRVDPDYRGEGVAVRLTTAGLDWLRSRGAAVARNLLSTTSGIPSIA